jgi:D-3-phosphoglycerate dehydrogenase
MIRPLIAVTDSAFPSLDAAMAALERVNPEMRMSKSASSDDILAVARDADAILVTYAKLPGDLLRQLKRCKVIGRFGLGVDNVDIPAAAECGITVTYVPDYCMQEVSDHAMALLLALVRKVPLSNKLVQAGRWEMPAVVPIHRLDGRVLGLVGFGNIARALAPKAKAFGLRVVRTILCFEEALTRRGSGHGLRGLGDFDFVSIHAPLTRDARYVQRGGVGKMKRARSSSTPRVDCCWQDALVAALDDGRPAAPRSTWSQTSRTEGPRPIGRDNVILTPHTAFYSVEALAEL